MLDERYEVRTAADVKTFEFDSVGPRETVRKVVRYSEINIKGFYNLGFGDKDPLTGFISDLSVTNNDDSQKVLATVAATLTLLHTLTQMLLLSRQVAQKPEPDCTGWVFQTT